MPYLWIKALHVTAVLVFVGGLLGVGVILAALGAKAPSEEERRLLAGVRRWDRLVTGPALLLVWALGLTLATEGGHFRSAWLPAKLAFVLFLSGVHGVQSGTLRRLTGGVAHRMPMTVLLPASLASLAVIAVLVIVKPF